MFALYAFHDQLDRVFRNVVASWENDQPDRSEISDAANNAYFVVEKLKVFRGHIEWQFPHETDAMQLLDKALQALLDDHGASLPHEVLIWWSDKRWHDKDKDIFATPDEKQTLVEIKERWFDIDRLRQKFWALKIDDKDEVFVNSYVQVDKYRWQIMQLTEERIQQVKQCLTDWLQERKDGHAY